MEEELFALAEEASTRAHVPFSHLQVGAALRTVRGGVYTGCNVENPSYTACICAERNAIFHAAADEGPDMRILEIAVFTTADVCSPCGSCRQVIAEFGPDARVTFPIRGRLVQMSVRELLPHPFVFNSPEPG